MICVVYSGTLQETRVSPLSTILVLPVHDRPQEDAPLRVRESTDVHGGLANGVLGNGMEIQSEIGVRCFLGHAAGHPLGVDHEQAVPV